MEDIINRIEEYNDDEDVIGAYDYEEKMEFIAASREREATRNGIEQGIEQGKLETAKNMLKENIDINMISKVTGLSIDHIKILDK